MNQKSTLFLLLLLSPALNCDCCFCVLGCQVLKGHDDHVITCLQFCGNRIVSGSDDNTLKVWSAVTGKVRWLLCCIPWEMSHRQGSGTAKVLLQGGLGCSGAGIGRCTGWTCGLPFPTQKLLQFKKVTLMWNCNAAHVTTAIYPCSLGNSAILVESIVTWILKNLDRNITLSSLKLNLGCICPSGSLFLTYLLAFFLLFSSFCNGVFILLAQISNADFVFLSKLLYCWATRKKKLTCFRFKYFLLN